MRDPRQHEETHHTSTFGARRRYRYKGSGLRRDFRQSDRRVKVRRLKGRETVHPNGTWEIDSPIGILASGIDRRINDRRKL